MYILYNLTLKFSIKLKLCIPIPRLFIFLVFSMMLIVFLNSFSNSSTTYGQIQTEETANVVENDVKGLIIKGNSLTDLANFTGAIPYYDKALDIDPNDTDASYNKGLALDQLGK